MGRETTGFSHKNNKQLYELANMVGVSSDDYWEEDTGSQGAFDQKGFTEAVEKAFSNDYSTRRALEAAHLAGEDVPKNIGSIEDAYAAHKWMKAQHGGGGKYSSDADRANIAHKWVNKDREAFTDDLNGQMESLLDSALGEERAKEEEQDPEGPVQLSDRLANSRERLETAATDPGGLYGSDLYDDEARFDSNNQEVYKNDDQKDGARNFFDNAKISFAQGLNLQEDVFNNLTNAANTATNIYGR